MKGRLRGSLSLSGEKTSEETFSAPCSGHRGLVDPRKDAVGNDFTVLVPILAVLLPTALLIPAVSVNEEDREVDAVVVRQRMTETWVFVQEGKAEGGENELKWMPSETTPRDARALTTGEAPREPHHQVSEIVDVSRGSPPSFDQKLRSSSRRESLQMSDAERENMKAEEESMRHIMLRSHSLFAHLGCLGFFRKRFF